MVLFISYRKLIEKQKRFDYLSKSEKHLFILNKILKSNEKSLFFCFSFDSLAKEEIFNGRYLIVVLKWSLVVKDMRKIFNFTKKIPDLKQDLNYAICD